MTRTTLPLLVALVGVMGVGIGSSITGWGNVQVEREKLRATLILRALDAPTENEAVRRLQFFSKIGIIELSASQSAALKAGGAPLVLPRCVTEAVRNGVLMQTCQLGDGVPTK